jgi:outer membrane protein OmpA-like peptidoglycan-associated protein
MANSLLDSLEGLVPAGVLGSLAGRLGESEAATTRGFNAAGTTILAGITSQLRESGAMRQIFDLLTSKANDGRILDDVNGYMAAGPTGSLGELGGNFLTAALGGRVASLGESIARATGLRPGSVTSMLNLAAPLVMGFLGRRIRQGGLDANGLAALLGSQKDSILKGLPDGVGSLLGFSEIPRVGAGIAAEGRTAARAATATGRRWLWPAVAALGLVALLFVLMRGRGAVEPISSTIGDQAVGAMEEAAATAATTVRDLGATVSRRLADGIELMIPERGIESQVVAFIEDPNRLVDRTTWFDFDRLTFETGSATIRPESREQLDNIAAILRAYPAVRIKVGGYTDNTGNRAANQRLSQDRADAVRDALIAKGVERDRIEAEGYGDQYPVGDNATEEGRAKNRRIALRVTAK